MSGGETSFSRRALTITVTAAICSFAAALLFGAVQDRLIVERSAGSDSFSYSAIGHRGLSLFLQRAGMRVLVWRSDQPMPLTPATAVLALEPQQRLATLAQRTERGGAALVIALRKWRGRVDAVRPRWIAERKLVSLSAARETVAGFAGALQPLQRIDGEQDLRCSFDDSDEHLQVVVDTPQLWQAPLDGLVPVVSCAAPTVTGATGATSSASVTGAISATTDATGVLVARVPAGASRPILLISDPDILNNLGLGQAQNARVIHDLLRAGPAAITDVVIDETVHGYLQRRSLIAELLRFPLGVALAHGALVLALLLWAAARRFGAPPPPPPTAVRSTAVAIENTAALIADAGKSAESVPLYVRQKVSRVARHFMVGDLPQRRLLPHLQQATDARGLRLHLDEQLRLAEQSAATADTEAAIRIAQRIYRWSRSMLHGS